ncbi:nucleotide exchange factor GrpE [Bacillus alkalisoli]|uniref:nucleotide exchange factor GrpE n=1 Tax=Bacillus alkalisoli TaxID=2011008 RepID=UPI000C2387F2|nr:nucleotide exchange factor GrpE [Bacillus alkalisoli]
MTTNKDNVTVEETNEQEVQEEIITEEFTEEVKEEAPVSNEEESTSALEELHSKLNESENKYLRLHADFDNFRRRVRLDQEATQKYRAQNLVTDILPALDNFERALKVDSEDEQIKTFLQGMDMVYRQLMDALKNEGVEVIEAVGQSFDPHLHQAIMQVEEEGVEPNTVVEEFQKGYKLKDRVIRPSMVKVSQ